VPTILSQQPSLAALVPRGSKTPNSSIKRTEGIQPLVEGKNENSATGEYAVNGLVPSFDMLAEHTLEGRLEDVSQRLRGQGGNRRQTVRGALQF
jgi:hypothetical protein